jgi:hypothetical protein
MIQTSCYCARSVLPATSRRYRSRAAGSTNAARPAHSRVFQPATRIIPGKIGRHVDEKGRRAFSQPLATGYWLERGSSGSPIFIGRGQQLAGLISMAELGDEPQNAPIREAYVVPGTVIWPYLQALAQREFDERQRAIQLALQKDKQADGALELIFEIARRSGTDESATFEQALANARAAFDEGLKAIEAGARGGNLGELVDDLLKKLAERTRLGDFAGGAARRGAARRMRIVPSRSGSKLRQIGAKYPGRRAFAFCPKGRGKSCYAVTSVQRRRASRGS